LLTLGTVSSGIQPRFSAYGTEKGESEMRSIGKIGLAALAVMAAMALAGATSASAVSTQLCDNHTGLSCEAGHAVTTLHQVLAAGSIGELLAIIPVLCLGFLVEANIGALGAGATKQTVTSVTQTFTGCGTSSAHNNCTVTIPTGQQPVFGLLKTGLDAGKLTATSGQTRLVCANIGLNCLYDVAGMEFSVGANHLTAKETPVNELGGKFFCPDEGLLDALLEVLDDPETETVEKAYVLG